MKARLSAVLLVALTAVGFTVVPAYAAAPPAPTFSALDTSVPGRVSGNVLTDAPWVQVGMVDHQLSNVSVASGSAPFNVETWGYTSANVRAYACTAFAAELSTCSPVALAPFTANNPSPSVTFSTNTDDGKVGPQETVSVTVDDPYDGGSVVARWRQGGVVAPGDAQSVNQHGTTALSLSDGVGTLEVVRCSTMTSACADFSPTISRDLDVQRTMPLSVSPIQPISTVRANTSFRITAAGRSGDYSLSYRWLRGGGDYGPTQTASGDLLPGGVVPDLSVLGTDFPLDGSYSLYGTMTVHDPVYGTYTGEFHGEHELTVWRQLPPVTSATSSRATIYPLVNTSAYPGSTTFTMATATGGNDKIEVRNSSGTTVRSLNTMWNGGFDALTATWNGKLTNGSVAPAGAYKAYLVDSYGNTATKYATVVVSTKKLVLKTYTATVSAAASTDEKFVGRCSTLRRPSLRGWAGSLGYYSGTKCGGTANQADAALTINSIRVPAAAAYKDVRVSVYGGAAKAKPRSIGVIQYMTTGGDFVNGKAISAAVGNHPGVLRSASGMIFSDRYFVWSFGTVRGSRYDVKNFTVTVHYYVLG